MKNEHCKTFGELPVTAHIEVVVRFSNKKEKGAGLEFIAIGSTEATYELTFTELSNGVFEDRVNRVIEALSDNR